MSIEPWKGQQTRRDAAATTSDHYAAAVTMSDVDLPTPGKRIAVRVSADAMRHIRAGHPWVFDRAIRSLSHQGRAGDLAVIFDNKRKFVAIGLYDPDSPIRIRILAKGRPTTIDQDFWTGRIDEALARRPNLIHPNGTHVSPDTTGYRLLHGENDQLPGLVADRFGDTVVVKAYSAAWFAHLREIIPAIAARIEPATVILRTARTIDRPVGSPGEGEAVIGTAAETADFREDGLVFTAHPQRGQKTGHFLDQRDNRIKVGSRSGGARVLDVFSHSGGFSVHAAAGGASEVTAVDQAQSALDAARANMAANRDQPAVAQCRFSTRQGDAFEILETMAQHGDRYDVVVIDPPSFAPNERSIGGALRSYARLTQLGLAVLAPNGLLVQASCSSRIDEEMFVRCVTDAASDAGRRLRGSQVTSHPEDHPIGFTEGGYLKAIFAIA